MYLSAKFFKWPDASERTETGQQLGESHFPLCVGIVDGTKLELMVKPRRHNACDFWCRKKCYALSTSNICDDWKKILHHYSGWPGSVHNNRIYKHSNIFTRPRIHFTAGKYLFGDNTFMNSDYMVPPFKTPVGQLPSKWCYCSPPNCTLEKISCILALYSKKGGWKHSLNFLLTFGPYNLSLTICNILKLKISLNRMKKQFNVQ
jgi:hypothetical protein